MGSIPAAAGQLLTLSDLLKRLGNISPKRVRLRPLPGKATEKDVLRVHAREDRLCELVDGTLVEKAMGFEESLLGVAIGTLIYDFVGRKNLGLVTGADGMMKFFPGLVRIPDVAFASWKRIPGGRVPKEPIPHLIPELVIEVLSETNTKQEMARKRQEYFAAGVILVWEVEPQDRTVTVYTSPTKSKVLTEAKTLSGGTVLPGFRLQLKKLFAELDRRAPG